MVDLLALASRSTSHRPSCPEARRAMPRYRPGTGCPARYRHGAVTLPRTSPRQRSGTVRTEVRRASWGGSPTPRPCSHPHDRPANRPAIRRGNRWHSSRAPAPLTLTLPKRGTGPVFRRHPPEGGLRQTRFRSRSALRSPVRGIPCRTHHPRSRGIFEFTGFSPELSRYPQETLVHPPFMHRVAHT